MCAAMHKNTSSNRIGEGNITNFVKIFGWEVAALGAIDGIDPWKKWTLALYIAQEVRHFPIKRLPSSLTNLRPNMLNHTQKKTYRML
jgi:hypothetical protein